MCRLLHVVCVRVCIYVIVYILCGGYLVSYACIMCMCVCGEHSGVCITFMCVWVHSYDYIYSNVSGNNIVSSISCSWVNEFHLYVWLRWRVGVIKWVRGMTGIVLGWICGLCL